MHSEKTAGPSEDDVMHRIGIAVYLSQELESTMHLAINIVFRNKTGDPLLNIEQLRDLNSKKTIGQLVQEMKKTVRLDDQFEKDLWSCICDRNRIVHGFSKEPGFKLDDETWRNDFVKFIDSYHTKRKRISAIFMAFVEFYLSHNAILNQARVERTGFYGSELYEEVKRHLPRLAEYIGRKS